jgi:hypothetical protein
MPQTDPFVVKKRTYNTIDPHHPQMQLKYGPLGATSIVTLNIDRAGAGQATSGPIYKPSNQASIVLSIPEFQAVWDAVFPASPNHPVTLDVTYVDQADPRYADVTGVVPRPALAPHVLLQAIQLDVSALSATTVAINQRLAHDLSASVVELHKLSGLIRLGLLKIGVSESELPAAARDLTYQHPSEPPTADTEMTSDYPPRFGRLPGSDESDGELRQ